MCGCRLLRRVTAGFLAEGLGSICGSRKRRRLPLPTLWASLISRWTADYAGLC